MLKFYIISTIVSYVVIEINWQAMKAKLKREGVYIKIPQTISEHLKETIYLLIPVLNILMAIVIQFGSEKIYEAAKKKMLEEARRGTVCQAIKNQHQES